MSRYPQAQEDSSSNDTMDEDEGGGNNSEDINEVYVSSIAGRSACMYFCSYIKRKLYR